MITEKQYLDLCETVAYWEDLFRKGLKYDEKQNIYVLNWTERQIKKAQEEAEKLMKKLNWESAK